MGKSKGKKSKARLLPKTKCCESRKKCDRCPLRMMKEGTLPEGFTVKKRVLVKVKNGKKVSKKQLQKAA